MAIHRLGSSAARVVMICAAAILAATSAFAEPRAITFNELPNPAALTFKDPFREMGFEMLEELRTVVRLEERLARGDTDAQARSRLKDRLAEARAALRANGHDVEGLLSQRWVVAENRKQAAIATNPKLQGAEVVIVGFLIPARTGETGKPMGYLVPEVGMCSHMPAPPPNQLVRVELAAPSPVKSPYAAVKVTGRLHPRPSNEIIYILDGKVRMVSMWMLKATQVVAAGDPSSSAAMNPWQDALRSRYGEAAGQANN